MMLDLLSRIFQIVVTPMLWISLTAAFVAVIVMILRRILRSRIPHQALCVLWLIVFARLLLPVSIETPFSLVPSNITNQIYQTAQEQEEPVEPETEAEPSAAVSESPEPEEPNHTQTAPAPVTSDPVFQPQIPAVSDPIPSMPVTSSPVISQPENPVASDPVLPEPQPSTPPVVEEEPSAPETPVLSGKELRVRNGQAIAASVWLLGVAAMLISGIVSYAKLRRQVYDAIRAEDGVWEHPSLQSPFILGLFRPKIYLPMGILGPARQFILQHEQAHLRRLDHIVKPICWLALAFHWFNPLVWGAFQLMGRDIENACDERVLRTLGSEVKADYSATLLALATNKRFPAPSPLSFGEGDAEERIKNVLKFKKPVLWVSIGAVVVAGIAAVCLLTNQSPRSIDSYYPQVDWEQTDTANASISLSDYPLDYGNVRLTADAATEIRMLLQGYQCWRDMTHLIPDNRRDWYYDWRVIYTFEDETSVEFTLCNTNQLAVTYFDGSNYKERHYSVDGLEDLKQAVRTVIDRQVEQTCTEGLRTAKKNIDVYSEEFPFLLAALLPVDVEFSLEDPLSADDCAAIFAQAVWLADPDQMVDIVGDNYFTPPTYIDLLLSEFLVGLDKVNWAEYSGTISTVLYFLSAPVDQCQFLEQAAMEEIAPYSEAETRQLMASLGLPYQGEKIYDVTVSFTYTGNEAVTRTYCVMFGEDTFRVLGASLTDGTNGAPVIPGYTTAPDYPGLYFLEEESSTVGKKITAYKLVDGKLVLVGGYDEHLTNNFSGLIGPDGVEQAIFKSPSEVYAMFEELLTAVLDPDWAPSAGEGNGKTEIPDYELTVHWDTLKKYTYHGETYPMEPVAIQLDLPQPITFERGTLLGADGEEIGYMALISVDEDLILDETIASQLGVFTLDGTLTTYNGEGMTFSTPWIRAGYDAVAYTSGSGPDVLYAYIRVSPTFVCYLSLQGEEYLSQWERCLMTLAVESGITYDTSSMTLLASLSEHELYLYKDSELLYPFLVYQGQQKQLNGTIIDTWIEPEFYPDDRDGDGVEEILLGFNQGHGTGLMEDGLLACQLYNGQLMVTVHDWSGVANHFNANNSFTYDPQTHTLSLSYGGYTATVVCPDYVDLTGYGSSAIITGEQVSYIANGDGSFTLSLIPAFSNGDPVAQYFDIDLQCTIRYDGYSFRVTEAPHLVCKDLRENSPPTGTIGDRLLAALDGSGRILSYGPSSTSLQLSTTMDEILDDVLQITQIAVLDLDGDGTKELLLQLGTSSMGYGTEILRYSRDDGRIYGYMLWVRAFMDVKEDGTFSYSGGAAYNGFGRLSFTDIGAATVSVADQQDGSYSVNGQPATEAAFLAAFAAQQEKADLTWTEYTPEIAKVLIKAHFDVTDAEQSSGQNFLSSLPTEIVAFNTLPTDPEEYYLVAKVSGAQVSLYSRNGGQETLLVWDDLSKSFERVTHTGYLNLPKTKLYSYPASDLGYLVVVSEVDTGTDVGVDELVCYDLRKKDSTAWSEYIYDWRIVADLFNKSNTLIYDAETNSVSIIYNGQEYTTGSLSVNLARDYGLEDGFTGALVANGDSVRYELNADDSITVTMQTSIAKGSQGSFDGWRWVGKDQDNACYPMSVGVAGATLTWKLNVFHGVFTEDPFSVELSGVEYGEGPLKDLPDNLVTSATLPAGPEEYYLVAEVPEEDIRLYARNSGSEVLVAKGTLWKTYDRRTHTEELILPQVWYKSGSQWETDALFTISQTRNDRTHYVEELACYQFYVGDWSKWADDAHDWCFKAEDFNRNNTVVYDAETNTFAMIYKGRTYYTQPVGDFPTSVNLPDGFTGVALITGHHVDYELQYTEYGRPSVSVTVKAALGFTSEGDFDENRIWQSPDGYYEQSVGQIGLTIVFYPSIQMGGFYYSDVHLKAGYEFPGLATTDGSETLWQDVVQNRIDAGFGDFYLIREDGTLVKWGSPDGALEGSHIGDNHTVDDPLVLMEHVVYVDANGEGSVFAIDENGTLWGMGSEADPDAPNTPRRIAENVAKVECGQYGDMFLMRDGTLWEGSGMLPALAKKEINGVVYNKVADNIADVSYEGFGSGAAVTADGELWVWFYPDVPPQKLADNAARVYGYHLFVTTKGELKTWSYNYDERAYSVSKALLTDVEYAVSSYFGPCYAVRTDGTLWEISDSGAKNIMDGVMGVAGGEQETVVLKTDGSLWQISEDGEITQIASGEE